MRRIGLAGGGRTAIALVSVCALAGPLALNAAPARAVTQFGSEGSGAGQFQEPGGVAVDRESGDVYVVDRNNQRVDKFDGAGSFLLAWGWGVADGKTEALQTCTTKCFTGFPHENEPGEGAGELFLPRGVAVDNSLSLSHEDVYVIDVRNHRVEKFDPNGKFLLMFGGGVDKKGGDVCTAAEEGECQAGTEGTANGQFEMRAEGDFIAVGATGTVYVGDNNRVQEFGPEGAYQAQVTLSEAGGTSGLAVDSTGDLYVISNALSGVRKYTASGELLQTLDFEGAPRAIALDSAGDVFVDDCLGGAELFCSEEQHHILEFDPAGTELASFDSDMEDGRRGIAFGDGIGELYVLNRKVVRLAPPPPPGPLVLEGSESAAEIKPTSVLLRATINPEGNDTNYRFEYGTSIAYGASTPVPEADIGSGFEDHAAEAQVSDLRVRTTYHYRVVATDSEGRVTFGTDQTFTTLPPALIASESVTNVASSSATLEAQINPLGSNTTYHLQYGPTTSCGGDECSVPVPDASIGSGTSDVEVAQHVQGLQPATTYRYRAVATNRLGTVEGEEQLFTTQSAGGAALPDGRSWEQVSPPDKHGARLLPISTFFLIQASAAGNAIAYVSTGPTGAEPQGNDAIFSQVLSTRAPAGWQSRDLAIPHNTASGVASVMEYPFFSEDLSLALLQPPGSFNPSLSAEASEQTPYLHTDYRSGDVNDPCMESCYRPLVTGKAGFENVPPGTVFGGETEGECVPVECGPFFVGANPDLSHVVLQSKVPLTAAPGSEGGLYEWAGGKLTPVPVSPGARHGISDDGSRIIGSGTMYDTTRGESVQLDAVQKGASGEGPPDPVFQDAASDGSRVFFTDQQQLTADAGASSEKPDLYECEMVEEAGAIHCRLSDLTPANAGESANVQGTVLGASEDGSWVYFVANGALASGAVRGTCHGQASTAGDMCNLYVRHGGTTKLIAVLSGEDSPDWAEGGADLTDLTVRVSPAGGWLAFMSQRRPTGYDNRDAISGEPDEEVYLYNAEASKLVCASCNPTGARPVGVEYGREGRNMPLVGGDRVWKETTWLAANIPGWTPWLGGNALHQSRYLSDSGRLFFNSSDALVPQDVNGNEDVYEHEPPGGSCKTSSVTFSERSGGCVGLISSGASPEESAFLDASESGGDVFFLTAAKLVPEDFDTALDVYDAHQCTAESPCFPAPAARPAPCSTADSCKPAPSPQPEIFGASGSATFSGAGNLAPALGTHGVRPKTLTRSQKLAAALKACRKKRNRKRRAACERRARQQFRARKSGKANARQRSGR